MNIQKLMKPHVDRIWKAGKRVHRVYVFVTIRPSVYIISYCFLHSCILMSHWCERCQRARAGSGSMWLFCFTYLVSNLQKAWHLASQLLEPLLYEVKSSCVLAPCLWTQPSVLTTRQAAAKVHGSPRKCVISFSGRTVAASPAPVQVSSPVSRMLGVGDSYRSLVTDRYQTFKYELNNKISKGNNSRISGRSAPVRCHSVLQLHSWKAVASSRGAWWRYIFGWFTGVADTLSSSRLKAGHEERDRLQEAACAWWCDAMSSR